VGVGCLFAFFTYIVLQAAIPLILYPWAKQLSSIHSGAADLLGLTVVGLLIWMGYRLGKSVSRNRKNQPLRHRIGEAARAVEEWQRVVGPMVEKARSDSQIIDNELAELHSRAQHAVLAPKSRGY
jgi:hypothetical protein